MSKGGTMELDIGWVVMVSDDHSGSGGTTAGYSEGATTGIVIRFKNAALTIYHAGAPNVLSDMRTISDLYSPNAALLSIGCNFTMGQTEAADAVTKLLEGIAHVVLMQHHTFPILAGSLTT
jgi:L-ascorbate metabolism protein UlaG (beta-lactamase superfamily)